MTPGNHLYARHIPGLISQVLCALRFESRFRDLQPDGEHHVDEQVSPAAGHDGHSEGRDCFCNVLVSEWSRGWGEWASLAEEADKTDKDCCGTIHVCGFRGSNLNVIRLL